MHVILDDHLACTGERTHAIEEYTPFTDARLHGGMANGRERKSRSATFRHGGSCECNLSSLYLNSERDVSHLRARKPVL
jgi:hypothetical protein